VGVGRRNESTGGERKNEKLTTHERKLANAIGEELNAEAQSSPNESRSTHHAAASFQLLLLVVVEVSLCNCYLTRVSVGVLKL
jgi:hypothetical protein